MAAARRPAAGLGLIGAAVGLAALWPLSAYAYGPALLPGALLVSGAILATIRRPEVGVAIAVALVPLRRFELNFPDQPGVQPVKFLLPVLAFTLLAYAALLARRTAFRSIPAVVPVALAFVVLTAISALQGIQPGNSVGELARVLTGGALVLATVQLCRRSDQLLVIAAGVVAGLAIAGTQGLLQEALGQVSNISIAVEGETIGRIEGSFAHPNQYAGYLAVLIPIAFSLAVSKRVPILVRWLSMVGVVVAVPALTFAYTRGALIGLVIGSLGWLAIARPRAAVPVLAVFVVGYLAIAPSVLQERIQNVQSGEVTLRSDLWGSALDIYSERPLFGVGIENFGAAYQNLPANLATASQRRLLHGNQVLIPPHAANLYLTWLAEEGILGLLSLLALGLVALVTAYRGSRSPDPVIRAVSLGVGAGLLTLAVHNVLEITLLDVLEPLLVLVAAIATLLAREQAPGG